MDRRRPRARLRIPIIHAVRPETLGSLYPRLPAAQQRSEHEPYRGGSHHRPVRRSHNQPFGVGDHVAARAALQVARRRSNHSRELNKTALILWHMLPLL